MAVTREVDHPVKAILPLRATTSLFVLSQSATPTFPSFPPLDVVDLARPQDSFVSMCHSVIQHGIVEKTPKYAAWEKEQADGAK